MREPESFWTDERIEDLKRRLSDGETAGEIAWAMRRSRNAILGKVWRLGLKFLSAGRPGPAKKRKRRVIGRRIVTFRMKPQKPPTPFKHPKRLIDLDRYQCRWPDDIDIAGKAGLALLFCGEPVFDDAAYCACHCRLAYTGVPRVKLT